MAVKSFFESLFLTSFRFGEDLQRLLRSDSVGYITEVDQINNLLWCHVCYDTPYRLAERLCPQIPDGVYNSTKSEMDNTLLWSDPAELRVVH